VRDVNIDGKSDIIEVSTHRNTNGTIDGTIIRLHLSQGRSFKIEYNEILESTILANSDNFLFGNFLGDGLLDCLDYKRGKTYRLRDSDRTNLVESLVDGFNHKTNFIYNNSVLTSNSLTRPSLDTLLYKPLKEFVIDSLISVGSDGLNKSLHYSYANPFYHLKGKGFIGFANQTVIENTSGFANTYSFNANERYAYSYPSKVIGADGTGTNISEKDFVYSNKTYAYGSYFAFPSQVISKDLVHNTIDTALYYYDLYGNDTLTVLKQNGDLVTKTRNQFIQKGSWCPASLASTTITKSSYANKPSYQKFLKYGYDSKGQVIRSSVYVNMADSLSTFFTYNAFGNILSKTTKPADGNKRIESYTYEAKNRFCTGLTKGNLSIIYTYNPATGSVLSETYPNGLVKTYEYDSFGNQTKAATSSTKYLSTEYAWSVDSPDNAVYSISQSDGIKESKAWFDDSGREVRKQTLGFSGDNILVDKQYSQRGNLKRESRPYLSGNTPSWNVFSYDTIGRIQTQSVNGSSLNYAYSNNTTTISNSNGVATRTYSSSLNGIGQIVSTVQNGKSLSFSYGNNGEITSVAPPSSGSSLNYTYDSRPTLTQATDPDIGTLKYDYNSLGELTHFETAKGDEDSIIYDYIGRDSIRIRENGNTNYSYYQSGSGKGNLSQVSSPSGFKKYSYNIDGNITRECDSISAQEAFPFVYEYDTYGRISKITYPGGFAVIYQYNVKGYLQYIKKASDNSTIWQCNTANELGNITQYSMSGGNIITYKTFDEYGYLTGIKTTAGSTTKQWFGYSFDPNTGDLNWRQDKIRSLTENFEYDVFDQLKWSKVTGQDSLLMEYNDIGNITFKSDIGDYFYNSTRIHAVDSVNDSKNTARQNISYNHFNKPIFIATASDSLVYTYTPLDQRIKAILYNSTGQVVKTTWYAGLYERVTTNSSTRHYYYINSPDGPVALAIQTGTETPVIYYICKDHLGSITGIMEADGDILEEYNYDPWGQRRNPANWSYTNVAVPTLTTRGFTGHEHLDAFNLINMNGRIYDPEIARFLSPDPVIQDQYNLLSYNRYSYCMNNPLKYTDPSGYIIRRPEEPYQFMDMGYINDLMNRITPHRVNGGGSGGRGSGSWIIYQSAVANGYDKGYGKFSIELSRQTSLSPLAKDQSNFTWSESKITSAGFFTLFDYYVPGLVENIVHSISLDPAGVGGADVEWISQYDTRVPDYGSEACKSACYIMNPNALRGMSNGFFVGKEKGKSFITTNQTLQGYQYLNQQLSMNRSVIVGVGRDLAGYWGNNANGDFTTDHFVVIDHPIGGDYHFLDPGSRNPAVGTSANNVFRLGANGLYTGSSYGAPMTITWIGFNQ